MRKKKLPTNKEELRLLCKALNLHHLSKIKSFEKKESVDNVDYLFQMLTYEIEERRKHVIDENKKDSHLPKYNPGRKFNGINNWNLNSANKLEWFKSGQSLLIYGKCKIGKTDLACQICETLLEEKIRVYYTKVDALLKAMEKPELKDNDILLRKCDDADVIVLDELFYLPMNNDDITSLYKKLMELLDKEIQFIFISNRRPQEWKNFIQDKYISETFYDRITNICRQLAIK